MGEIIGNELLTKNYLIETGFSIQKKFVIVDSSKFNDEAFDYIKELVDAAGSILFVSDTKKIYVHGRYFGGDIFQDDLLYFTNFVSYDNEGNITGQTTARRPKSSLQLQGLGHMQAIAEYDDITGENKIKFDYDLNSAVNNEQFTLDSNAKYNLAVVDGQIKMQKYVPISLKVSSLPVLEYDSGDTVVEINIMVSGTYSLQSLSTKTNIDTEDKKYIVGFDSETSKLFVEIPNNTDVEIYITYSDGIETNVITVKQLWGSYCFYGTTDFDLENINDSFKNYPNKYLITNDPSKTITIEQNGYEFGYFICPSKYKLIFTDSSNNLQGGWKKINDFTYYSTDINYTIYRTENSGLGKIKWIISKK